MPWTDLIALHDPASVSFALIGILGAVSALLGAVLPEPTPLPRPAQIPLGVENADAPHLSCFYLSTGAQSWLSDQDDPLMRLLPNGHSNLSLVALDDHTYESGGLCCRPHAVVKDGLDTFVVMVTPQGFDDQAVGRRHFAQALYYAIAATLAVDQYARTVLRFTDAVVEISNTQSIKAYLWSLHTNRERSLEPESAARLARRATARFRGNWVGELIPDSRQSAPVLQLIRGGRR